MSPLPDSAQTDRQPVFADDLGKTYASLFGRRKVRALHSLSLSIEKGEIFGLLGPNGAGKTTLLKLLLGIIKPTDGRASLFGHSIDTPDARARIGFLPENHRFPPFLTAAQTLLVYGRLANLNSAEIQDRAPKLIKMVGLSEWANVRLKEFSKGMTQRLGIAQALLSEPELLFLDEPTDGVDPIGRREIRDLLLDLKNAGMTIFLNSHLLSEVELICTRVGILHKGRLVRSGSVQELTRAVGAYRIHFSRADAPRIADLFPSVTVSEDNAAAADVFARILANDVKELNEWIDRFRENGISIFSVVPDQISLESRFMEIIASLDGDSTNIQRSDVRQNDPVTNDSASSADAGGQSS